MKKHHKKKQYLATLMYKASKFGGPKFSPIHKNCGESLLTCSLLCEEIQTKTSIIPYVYMYMYVYMYIRIYIYTYMGVDRNKGYLGQLQSPINRETTAIPMVSIAGGF